MPSIDVAELVRLIRRDLPRPTDVLNQFDLRDNGHYARYVRLVAPTMRAAGAQVLWTGRCESVLRGPAPPQHLLITRYPSHRRCLLVVTNPLYVVLNQIRASGVSSYAAAFMSADAGGEARLGDRLLVIGHDGDERAAAAALEQLAASLGAPPYAAGQTGSFSFVRRPGPTDAKPPRHPAITCFAAPADAPAPDAALRSLPAEASAAIFVVYEHPGYARLRPRPAAES